MENNIPEGVVDKEAYQEFLKLSVNPILNNKKIVICTDGTEVNLAVFPHIITKLVEHLPVEEQNSILTKKSIYYKLQNKLTAVKRKAFGKPQGGANVKGSSGLLSDRRTELVELFGRMFSIEETLKVVNKEWGIPVSKDTVKRFRTENREEIEKRIDIFKASYADIRLGVKRSRLEELVYLYSRQKDKYIDTNAREDYKLLLSTLDHIRKEAEGDRLTINGKVDVSYEANVHMHLREEVYKSLNLKEIILGRVAARMGISPIKLIYSLNNSFYNKFSNVLGTFNEEEALATDLVYPSQMNYDFERIKREAQKRDDEIEDAIVLEENNDDKDMSRAERIKQEMLDKIARKKEKSMGMKANINNKTAVEEKDKVKDISKNNPKKK
jgi:hypothetical protein